MNYIQKKHRRILLSSIVLLVLAACGKESSKPPQDLGYAGIWSAPAYGQVIEYRFTDKSYTLDTYLVTSTGCLLFEEEQGLSFLDVTSTSKLNDEKTELELVDKGQVMTPGVVFTKIEAVPDNCINERYVLHGEQGYSFDANRDFEIFWNTFNELYFDFSLSDTDWNEVYVAAEAEIANVTDEEGLFDVLSQMIEPLEDGHNIVVSGDLSNGLLELLRSDDAEIFSVSHKDDYENKWFKEYIEEHQLQEPYTEEQLAAAENYVEETFSSVINTILSYADEETIEVGANNSIAWFKTEDNLGYIIIDSMSDYTEEAFDLEADIPVAHQVIDQAILDLQDTRGLIIDVRLNDGGSDEVSLILASRFISGSTHVYSKQARLGNERTPLVDVSISSDGDIQYLGPIALLTSESTVSAAEVFTLSMRNLDNVTLIGEATAGAFSDILVNRVTSNIAYGFSNEFYLSPSSEWFERSGIPVDIDVPFVTKQERELERDFGIERAMELLNE